MSSAVYLGYSSLPARLFPVAPLFCVPSIRRASLSPHLLSRSVLSTRPHPHPSSFVGVPCEINPRLSWASAGLTRTRTSCGTGGGGIDGFVGGSLIAWGRLRSGNRGRGGQERDGRNARVQACGPPIPSQRAGSPEHGLEWIEKVAYRCGGRGVRVSGRPGGGGK